MSGDSGVIPFVSSNAIKEKKDTKKAYRQAAIEKAKKDYERAERREEQKKQSGEADWMLPSLAKRLEEDKKLHSKKKKKERKKKKKHKKKSESSSSESEAEWVEAGGSKVSAPVVGPKIQRESWMMGPSAQPEAEEKEGAGSDRLTDLFGGVTRAELRARDKKESPPPNLDEPGQHALELNPYWQDGGSGLPEQKKRPETKPGRGVGGDGGLAWLRKALQRCRETAEDSGRTLEDVAADRYGSLERLKQRIREAEDAAKGPGFRRPRSRSRSPRNRAQSRKFMRPGERSSENQRPSGQSRSPPRKGWRKPGNSSPRSPKSRRSRSRSPKSQRSRSRSPRRTFERPRSRSRSPKMRTNRRVSRSRSRSRSPPRRKMMRSKSRSRSRSRSRSPKRRSRSRSSSSKEDSRRGRDSRKEGGSGKKKGADTMDVSESDSSSDGSGPSEASGSEEETPQVALLTETQMNQLGARIVKAEILGDEGLAAALKAELEAAREARANHVATPRPTRPNAGGKRKEEEVLLTRTDRAGNVRPVAGAAEETQGSRRRGKKVVTHDKSGQRTQYFADDDKFSLKSLVERERMRTAEDDNMMFARLAGKSVERTDDEYQIDDVFVNRANRDMADGKAHEKDRAAAIMEHRRQDKATARCRYCFDNVAKHLIVSIGSKAYVSLPNHTSLAEGHCLIVPSQHVASGTACDDDVWAEMMDYRKALVRMFEAEGEDCVFMEMSRGLRHHPHAAIECVPLPRELGDMAPIYFKKALEEADSEWAQNKKIVQLAGKGLRRAVPKGFPYFAVDFGTQDGYAHVIEEEHLMQPWFGREVVGGMLDVEPTLWRKPRHETFDQSTAKVLRFAQKWAPYDPAAS